MTVLTSADGHTGAGMNEVTLTPYKDMAVAAFLNATHQQFKLDSFNTPFAFSLGGDDDYAGK